MELRVKKLANGYAAYKGTKRIGEIDTHHDALYNAWAASKEHISLWNDVRILDGVIDSTVDNVDGFQLLFGNYAGKRKVIPVPNMEKGEHILYTKVMRHSNADYAAIYKGNRMYLFKEIFGGIRGKLEKAYAL